eukprot:scaffold436_cov336-Pavlova_lutheri.AAC.18
MCTDRISWRAPANLGDPHRRIRTEAQHPQQPTSSHQGMPQSWMSVLQNFQMQSQPQTTAHPNPGTYAKYLADNPGQEEQVVQLSLSHLQSQGIVPPNQPIRITAPGGGGQSFVLVPTGGSGDAYTMHPAPQMGSPDPRPPCPSTQRNTSSGEDSREAASKKRTSRYRGVTKHRRSGRWEAHIWVKETGKQVYLGGYEHEEHAAEAYDVAAIKCKGSTVKTNFPMSKYTELMAFMENITLEELVMAVRRQSQGFARGSSSYRGVTHHPNGRWEARIGMPGSKHIYLGLYNDERDAACAYDRALVRLRGPVAATNFSLGEYKDELQEYHQRQQDELQAQKAQALEYHKGKEVQQEDKSDSRDGSEGCDERLQQELSGPSCVHMEDGQDDKLESPVLGTGAPRKNSTAGQVSSDSRKVQKCGNQCTAGEEGSRRTGSPPATEQEAEDTSDLEENKAEGTGTKRKEAEKGTAVHGGDIATIAATQV